MITLKNGLIISADNNGFESINHLTSKIDKGSFTKFNELPDIFYKEMDTDDRTSYLTTSSQKHMGIANGQFNHTMTSN